MGARPAVTESDTDRLLGFTLPERGVRGRLVRLGPLVDVVLGAHAYPPAIGRLLAEALVLTGLLGALLRGEGGQLTLQAKGSGGPCALLVADFRGSELRGYAAVELDRRYPPLPERAATLSSLFGDGQLVITLDQSATAERYQGIVELGRTSLVDAVRGYFRQSEQIPTLLDIAVEQQDDGHWIAGGLLLQQLARSELDGARLHVADMADWERVAALGATVGAAELFDPALPLETLLWRLFHEEEVHLLGERRLERGCRCSMAHIRDVLGQFPEEERAEMRNSDGVIAVDCEFCARQFLLDL